MLLFYYSNANTILVLFVLLYSICTNAFYQIKLRDINVTNICRVIVSNLEL